MTNTVQRRVSRRQSALLFQDRTNSLDSPHTKVKLIGNLIMIFRNEKKTACSIVIWCPFHIFDSTFCSCWYNYFFPHESVSCFFIDVIFMNHPQSSNKTRLFAGKSINGKRDSGANIHLSGMNDLSEEVFVDEYNETQGLTR